jgi:hypothetical protein
MAAPLSLDKYAPTSDFDPLLLDFFSGILDFTRTDARRTLRVTAPSMLNPHTGCVHAHETSPSSTEVSTAARCLSLSWLLFRLAAPETFLRSADTTSSSGATINQLHDLVLELLHRIATVPVGGIRPEHDLVRDLQVDGDDYHGPWH